MSSFRQQRKRLGMPTKKVDSFKIIAIKHNPPLDGVNCGVHVIEV